MPGPNECKAVRLPGGDWDYLCKVYEPTYSAADLPLPAAPAAVAPKVDASKSEAPNTERVCRYGWSGFDAYECVQRPAQTNSNVVVTRSLWSELVAWLEGK